MSEVSAPEMQTGLQVIRKLFYGRRTAKQVCNTLSRLTESWDVGTQVFVVHDDGQNASNRGAHIVIEVLCPMDKVGEVKGAMALGHPEVDNWPENPIPDQCYEYYRGPGIKRFRGV